MKTLLLTLLAVTGCRSGLLPERGGTPADDLAAFSFPIGTYTNCAQGTHNPSGNNFLNGAGFQSGAVLTLTQSGNTVTATFVDQDGVTQSTRFAATTGTSATLDEKDLVIPGPTSLCVMGPGNESFYPSSMTVAAGVLSYDAGTVFITLTGSLQSDAGACGKLSQADASFWLLCEDRQGGAPAVDPGPATAAQLPVGEYPCSAQVETYAHINGTNQFVASGGSGTVTLTADGAKVTAQYGGDRYLAGTLRFSATTATTAHAEAGQTLMTPCMVPITETGVPSQAPEPLPIAAGSLTLVDSTLFLSFAGTMGDSSACPGAQVAGSVICSR